TLVHTPSVQATICAQAGSASVNVGPAYFTQRMRLTNAKEELARTSTPAPSTVVFTSSPPLRSVPHTGPCFTMMRSLGRNSARDETSAQIDTPTEGVSSCARTGALRLANGSSVVAPA